MSRFDLSDAEWAMWEPFFPPERGRVGQPGDPRTWGVTVQKRF